MPSTSRPWTRGECCAAASMKPGRGQLQPRCRPAQRAALQRLEFEFGSELTEHGRPGVRRSASRSPTSPNAPRRAATSSRAPPRLARTQRFSLGAVLNNRPGNDFAFYERFELTGWQPENRRGHHSSPTPPACTSPARGVLPWRNMATLETELAYLAFRIPWLRLEARPRRIRLGPGLLRLGDARRHRARARPHPALRELPQLQVPHLHLAAFTLGTKPALPLRPAHRAVALEPADPGRRVDERRRRGTNCSRGNSAGSSTRSYPST